MALNENEKKIVRMLIAAQPQVEYMERLAASDEFARSEIKTFALRRRLQLAEAQSQMAANQQAFAEQVTLLETVDQ